MHPSKTDRPDNMRVIGITGGVGAGKSRILKILKEEYGAYILLADEVAAGLEEPGQEGLRQLVECFGREILDADERLDRGAFAERIFKDPKALTQVNAIIHPLTWQALCKQVTEIALSVPKGRKALIAVEAALFDRQSRRLCDMLWYVDASEENRVARLMENRGYTREKCRNIMKNQPGRESFLALADAVIDNNGTMEETREQIVRQLGEPESVTTTDRISVTAKEKVGKAGR